VTRHRVTMAYAILGCLAAIAGAVGAVALRIADPVPQLKSTFGFGDTALVGFCVLGVSFAVVGALLVVRRPGNIVGWFMVAIGVGYAVGVFWAAVTYSLAAHPSAVSWLDMRVAAWLTVVFTTIGGLVFALGFVFPTGRGQTPTWDRWLRVAAVLAIPGFVFMFVIRPGPLHVFPDIENPFGFGFDLRLLYGDQVSERISAMSVVFVPLVVWSIVARYRHGGHVERQQLKWVGLATAVAIGALAVAGFSAGSGNRPSELGLAVYGFAGALIPVAIGIAILRHGLYDIDRIISRTIAYAAITAVLAVVFVAVILAVGSIGTVITQGLVPSTQGRSAGVAISTLVVFALFQPVRGRIQRAVDRHFDRARYDGEQTVAAFAERLRSDHDLASISADVTRTADATMHPTSAAIWLRVGQEARR